MTFVCIGSRVQILGVGSADYGGEIDVPDELAGIWKRPGGPIIIPVDKFAELGENQSACLEYLSDVRAGGEE